MNLLDKVSVAMDSVLAAYNSALDKFEFIRSSGKALHTYIASKQAGETLEESTVGDSFTDSVGTWKVAVIDLSLGTQTIFTGKCVLGNVWVASTMNAVAATIDDDVITLFPIPASSAVGDNWRYQNGSRILTSLKVTPGSGSPTGVVHIQYRPGHPSWIA